MEFLKKLNDRGGAEARRIAIRLGIALIACCLMAGVQDGKRAAAVAKQNTASAAAQKQNHMTPDTKVAVVPITEEHHHHLVLDNEYVRVFHVEVAPHEETLYHQHDMDYVFVTLGDSVVESVRVGEKPVKLELKDGDTRFTKGGFAHKAVNLSDKPFVNVTVELKKKIGKNYTETGQSVATGSVGDCMPVSMGGSPNCRNIYGHSSAVLDSAHWKIASRDIQNSVYSLIHPGLVIFIDDGQIELVRDQKSLYKSGEAVWAAASARLTADGALRFATVECSSVALPRDQELSAPKRK